MDPDLLEEAIEDRYRKTGCYPKAIIPVHFIWYAGQYGAHIGCADKYGISVLEDAAEALGSEYKGRKCGTFGVLNCLSFNGKMITTSGGGALVCCTAEQAAKTKFYATKPVTRLRITNIRTSVTITARAIICAGIGRGQMTVLQDHVERRRAIHQLYSAALTSIKAFACSKILRPTTPNHWPTCIPMILCRPDLAAKTCVSPSKPKTSNPAPLETHAPATRLRRLPFYGNGTSNSSTKASACLPALR